MANVKTADPFTPAVDYIADLCVKLGLDFIEQHATLKSARRFYVYHGKTCLVAADDPMQVEHYLYGWRDARNIPMPKAHDAADALLEVRQYVIDMKQGAESVQHWVQKLDDFIDPLTREGAQ
jgi:hypothetical protein